jgi:hypothetical protein
MVVAAFVAPYRLESTARFALAAAGLPDVRLGSVVVSEVAAGPPGAQIASMIGFSHAVDRIVTGLRVQLLEAQ